MDDLCPRCKGPTELHCTQDDCRMLRCTQCGAFGVEGARTWLDPRKWDQPA